MGVNTTGIRTNVNCANPNQISVSPTSANLSTISATSADGCLRQLTLNPNDADQQYGVVNVPNCSVNNNNTLDVAFQPVRPLFSSFRCELVVLIVQIRSSSGFGSRIRALWPAFSANHRYSFLT